MLRAATDGPGDRTLPATGQHAGPDPAQLLGRLRAVHASGLTRPLGWRRSQLDGLRRLLHEHEDELVAALAADLGKPAIEAWLTELGHVANEIEHIGRNLARWCSPEPVAVRAALRPARARIVPEPLGVCLVIAPWNYPLHLLVLPMAYAIAAGNAVVGKPSELAPATSAALARLVPCYLDERAVAIVEGDATTVTGLLEQRWDHIFYTGNGRVGRIVMTAAARHLTPVTLELGGKSPVVVDRSAAVDVAARRVAWGKYVNAGQTCVAPDYVLVERELHDRFVDALVRAVDDFYGPDPAASPDYARIVNAHHVERLARLLQAARPDQIATGGRVERSTRYVAPTVLTGVDGDHPVMQEEIFGPILPVLAVEDLGSAIAAINARDKPLALYVFAEDDAAVRRVVEETSSGGVCVNATLLQLAVTDLPFGGVGASGMGAYHGRAGFDTFSHRKSVLERRTRPDPSVIYPPYTRAKQWLMRRAFSAPTP
jgi:aldehyde dehydrogenase (NAD+)